MSAWQKKFGKAARRCRGDSQCMSKALSGEGLGLLPRADVAGTKCVKYKKTPAGLRCKKYAYSGKYAKKKGQRGIWKELYGEKGYYWTAGTMPTHGKKCKGYKAVGRACKPRCASYTAKKGAKTKTAARAACKRRKKR